MGIAQLEPLMANGPWAFVLTVSVPVLAIVIMFVCAMWKARRSGVPRSSTRWRSWFVPSVLGSVAACRDGYFRQRTWLSSSHQASR